MRALQIVACCFSAIFTVYAAQSSQSCPFHMFTQTADHKAASPFVAVVRILADLSGTIMNHQRDGAWRDLKESLATLRGGGDDCFLMGEMFGKVREKCGIRSPTAILDHICGLKGVLHNYSHMDDVMIDDIQSIDEQWKPLAALSHKVLVLDSTKSNLPRRHIKCQDRYFSLSHCITKGPNDLHYMIKYDLERSRVDVVYVNSWTQQPISTADGDGLLPAGHKPIILFYTERNDNVTGGRKFPFAFPAHSRHEHIRVPLFILAYILDRKSLTDYSGGEEGLYRGEAKFVWKELNDFSLSQDARNTATMDMLNELIILCKSSLCQYFSTFEHTCKSLCMICSRSKVDRYSSYQHDFVIPTKPFSATLQTMDRSTTIRQEMRLCSACDLKTTHSVAHTVKVTHTANFMIVSVPKEISGSDIPIRDANIGGYSYPSLKVAMTVDDKGVAAAWIMLKAGVWMKYGKEGVEVVIANDGNVAPFDGPALLVYSTEQ